MTLILAGSLLAIGALAFAASAVGQSGTEGRPPITSHGEWRRLAPQSSWSIWQPACIVQSIMSDGPLQASPATVTLSISTVAGADIYLVSISSDFWTDISDGEKLSVDFGFDNEPPEEGSTFVSSLVLGHTGGGEAGPGFHTGVDEKFLRRMANSATMEVYRDGSEAISLDTSDAIKAIEILQACGTVEHARIGVPAEDLYSVERASRAQGAENAER